MMLRFAFLGILASVLLLPEVVPLKHGRQRHLYCAICQAVVDEVWHEIGLLKAEIAKEYQAELDAEAGITPKDQKPAETAQDRSETPVESSKDQKPTEAKDGSGDQKPPEAKEDQKPTETKKTKDQKPAESKDTKDQKPTETKETKDQKPAESKDTKDQKPAESTDTKDQKVSKAKDAKDQTPPEAKPDGDVSPDSTQGQTPEEDDADDSSETDGDVKSTKEKKIKKKIRNPRSTKNLRRIFRRVCGSMKNYGLTQSPQPESRLGVVRLKNFAGEDLKKKHIGADDDMHDTFRQYCESVIEENRDDMDEIFKIKKFSPADLKAHLCGRAARTCKSSELGGKRIPKLPVRKKKKKNRKRKTRFRDMEPDGDYGDYGDDEDEPQQLSDEELEQKEKEYWEMERARQERLRKEREQRYRDEL